MKIKERRLDNMKKTDLYKYMLEELNDPNNQYEMIIKTYVTSEKEISENYFSKFTINDEEFAKKCAKAQREYIKYLITTYYMDKEFFKELIKILSEQEIEYFKKYLKNNKEKGEYEDLLESLNKLKKAKVIKKLTK